MFILSEQLDKYLTSSFSKVYSLLIVRRYRWFFEKETERLIVYFDLKTNA